MTRLFIRLASYFSSHRAVCWLSMAALFVFFGYFAMQIHLEEDINFTTVNGDGIGNVVPEKITVANLDDSVNCYMRVRSVSTNTVINCYVGDEKIATKKAQKFVPAEMVNFKIKKSVLEKYGDGELKFVVEPKEA